ncbi:hypothetical protein GDO81_023571 [Engystomops pustulosus]|uniref:Uncharacterized protein n=1 Tax=Engystomops pustulosus TaxID=76066 RepID=A0AAV6YRZ7_ENGPU|nr:hypothetical protein GDO81_023571 [Engystomops pustulosus]
MPQEETGRGVWRTGGPNMRRMEDRSYYMEDYIIMGGSVLHYFGVGAVTLSSLEVYKGEEGIIVCSPYGSSGRSYILSLKPLVMKGSLVLHVQLRLTGH